MPSNLPPSRVDWQRRTEPADLVEWMDEPCSYEELRACLRDLGQVNTLTGGFRPTLSFLERLIILKKTPAKLRILDVGFGGGDAMHRIRRWSSRRGMSVELTGIDLNPYAVRVAKEKYSDDNIQWLVGDALAYQGEVDVVISSLLTHHLATGQIVQFIRWMESKASVGWFVNDLERSARSASLFSVLSRVMRWHRFVQHDGPVSFARSFVSDDWRQMLSQADVPLGAAEVCRSFPSRLCVSRFK